MDSIMPGFEFSGIFGSFWTFLISASLPASICPADAVEPVAAVVSAFLPQPLASVIETPMANSREEMEIRFM